MNMPRIFSGLKQELKAIQTFLNPEGLRLSLNYSSVISASDGGCKVYVPPGALSILIVPEYYGVNEDSYVTYFVNGVPFSDITYENRPVIIGNKWVEYGEFEIIVPEHQSILLSVQAISKIDKIIITNGILGGIREEIGRLKTKILETLNA